MGIAYEGDLGQFPNLDLINVATAALRNQNLAPQVLSLLRSLLACKKKKKKRKEKTEPRAAGTQFTTQFTCLYLYASTQGQRLTPEGAARAAAAELCSLAYRERPFFFFFFLQ